jgi:hypothetical protein
MVISCLASCVCQLERFLLVMTKPDTVVMESVAGSKTQRLRALQQMIKEYAGAMVVWLATLISATSRFALQVHWYVSWHQLYNSQLLV